MRNTVRYLCWMLLAAQVAASAQIISPKFYSVLVSATIQRSPAAIRLEWPGDQYATSYAISRKAGSATAWTHLTTLPGTAGHFIDNNVTPGVGYEYQILKTTSKGYAGSGYIYSGIDLPAVESRGKIILLVDSTFASQLSSELRRLQFDLVGDGWTVLRHDVPRNTSIPNVKNTIKSAYLTDPANVKALFLFGHIPVPYSGDYAGDSHDNHRGAWPADVYYGDMDGVWTDFSVNRTTAEKAWNHNVPGDGKFDQSVLPSDVELQVGRVDLYYMTCFANKSPSRDELTLLRQYLNKDHRFRHGQLPLPRRGLIIDNFGGDKEALASTGWRNFAPLFGADNITEIAWGTFFPTISSQGYLWSYGTGGGSYYTCAGIGSSDDFALNDIRTVFTFFFGSYYGDWDNESNFLRAPLGSTTYTLTSAWGGRPHWFVHHMALGETIGFSTRLTQNNFGAGEYEPDNFGQREVHTSLHGDPTLRLHPVIPPANLTATLGNGVTLSWSASPDESIVGYRVYRANSEFGPYPRISGANNLTGTSFNDPSGTSSSIYMVRAIKWEASASGTYFNPSQGIFAAVQSSPTLPPAPAAPSNLSGTALSTSSIRLNWNDNSANESGFQVLRRAGTASPVLIASLPANSTAFTDQGLAANTTYFYQVSAWNQGGTTHSAEIQVATPAPAPTGSATFISDDWTTRGSWKPKYGGSGYVVITHVTNTPANILWSTANAFSWEGPRSATGLSYLEKIPGPDRVVGSWYNVNFTLTIDFPAGETHRTALYFADTNRRQQIDVLDASGNILDTRVIENFGGGVYLNWDLSGRVTFRFTRLVGNNAVLNGIFLGASGYSAPAPQPEPIRFLGANTTTRGSWKGAFGSLGNRIVADTPQLPADATLSPSGNSEWVWTYSTTDSRALQRNHIDTRMATCWYSAGFFDLDLNLTSGQSRKVSFYFLDWDNAGREQKVEIINPATGAVLSTQTVSSFGNGTYLSYNLTGRVIARFTRIKGPNAVISGIFFDSPQQ